MFSLAAIAFFVGVLIGTVGIGGILLIPAIAAFTGMDTHEAMATALFSFIFTAVIGTYMFHRKGSIDWLIAMPICAGALVFGYLGALVNSRVNVLWLNTALALVIIFAGAYVLKPASGSGPFAFDRRSPMHLALLGSIGAVVGFISGLTGVGGPVLSVPIMVVLGFAPITAVATGQVIQVAAAGSGTVGNLIHGIIDFGAASWLTVVQLAGLIIGIRFAHSIRSRHLRTLVAVVCIGVGGFLLARSLGQIVMFG
ncbi:sulfite exporter TauE/SafE family protein [Fundidesulfovibrio agrisoli]|uniref:sulfite exporter TauE/SafE family protein n=1 Tax=Fundidesulfovibrio agrisoli TaxID=2922717 RepID=UPI001FAE3B49|nr:sulfite exporter TauE/SafE family protein [Fundidesulfovibrio agrisoli]